MPGLDCCDDCRGFGCDGCRDIFSSEISSAGGVCRDSLCCVAGLLRFEEALPLFFERFGPALYATLKGVAATFLNPVQGLLGQFFLFLGSSSWCPSWFFWLGEEVVLLRIFGFWRCRGSLVELGARKCKHTEFGSRRRQPVRVGADRDGDRCWAGACTINKHWPGCVRHWCGGRPAMVGRHVLRVRATGLQRS